MGHVSVPVTAESVLTQQGLKIAIGGTDNHLLLVDLSACGIDGDRASILLEVANIIVNKNRIPGDTGTATKPFGIRLGTPALTSRGKGPDVHQSAEPGASEHLAVSAARDGLRFRWLSSAAPTCSDPGGGSLAPAVEVTLAVEGLGTVDPDKRRFLLTT